VLGDNDLVLTCVCGSFWCFLGCVARSSGAADCVCMCVRLNSPHLVPLWFCLIVKHFTVRAWAAH
jgi:hypothetical protein